MKRVFLLLVVTLVLVAQISAIAETAPVGDIEFDNLFIGVNDFTVDNFTGMNNLGFFPAADSLTFDSSVLRATESDGTVLTFDLGNISPGSNTSAEAADSLLFAQASFSSALDPSSFTLTNGFSGIFDADPSLSFTLLPSSGSTPVAGVDLRTTNASSSSPSPVPKPSTLVLTALEDRTGARLQAPKSSPFQY